MESKIIIIQVSSVGVYRTDVSSGWFVIPRYFKGAFSFPGDKKLKGPLIRSAGAASSLTGTE